MLRFSVTIPAYNEERGIADILGRTLKTCASLRSEVPGVDGYEVIVVNDGSRDSTASIVGTFPGVSLIEHPTNRGYGAALKTGFAAAQGDYIGFLDADGTYPPECFPELLRTAIRTGADMVIGSRMAGMQSEMPLLRRVGNTAFALLLSWVANTRVSDTASGMRILKKESLARLRPLPDGLELTPALSTLALHEGLTVVEVPIPYAERAGRSKLNALRDGVRFVSTIVGLAEIYNPLKFFGVAGIFMLGLALLLGIGPVVHYLRYRAVPLSEIYRLLTILVLVVSGLNVLLFGIAANHVIALARGSAGTDHWLARLVHVGRLKRLGLFGLVLVGAAILLNGQGIYNYLTTFRVGVHWSYMLTGVFLFLTGSHLFMISRLVRVFELLREQVRMDPASGHSERRAKDPGPKG